MQSNNIHAWVLIQQSEEYLSQAHRLLPDLLATDTKNEPPPIQKSATLNLYNTLIKASLNCLFKVLRNYTSVLDSNIQAILYYKTSQILHRETISSNLALDYNIRGIQICKRDEPKLTLLKLKLQYLNFQIQLSSNRNVQNSLAYWNDVINNEIPNDASYLGIKCFFQLMKYKSFHTLFSTDNNISYLENILCQIEETITGYNNAFSKLVLINLIELQLLNGIPNEAISLNIEKLKDTPSDQNNKSELSVFFSAMTFLFQMLVDLRKCDVDGATEHARKLDQFLKSIKHSNTKWPSKLIFNCPVIAESNTFFPFEIKWLSFKNFSMIAYFYCAILFSFTSWDGKKKGDKLFNVLFPSSQKINARPMSLDELQSSQLKANYMQVLFSLYQVLSDFTSDKYPVVNSHKWNSDIDMLSNYKHLHQFMKHYEYKEFSPTELMAYSTLIPFIKYVLAMICQRNGDFYKSLYYYSEVIFICEDTTKEKDNPANLLFITGLTSLDYIPRQNNQFTILSILNAIPTLEYIIEEEKVKHLKISEFDINYDVTMSRFRGLLKVKDRLITLLNNSASYIRHIDSMLFELSVSMTTYFYLPKKTQKNQDLKTFIKKESSYNDGFYTDEFLNVVESKSPLLASYLYLIRGYSYISDPGIGELENLNARVAFFTNACKFSLKALSDDQVNGIAELGYLEIFKIMDRNKNLYSQENIDHVYEKYTHFAAYHNNSDHLKSKDTNSAKRVKFV